MNNDREESNSEGDNGGKFHIVQPFRDPESNWAVDLAKNLEEYLLKICSGEVCGDEDRNLSVNFAEAALLLQGSVQVYSRKVEYLYSLVLHALEFISQKRQQEPSEKSSVQPEGSDFQAIADEENEPFLGLDDIPVEAKNCLDVVLNKDDALTHFVKCPANLVVIEGNCFDTTGDSAELESYLLATHDLYQDFILLDPFDAGAIDDFLKGNKDGIVNNVAHRGSSLRSEFRKSFLQSPTRRSGGTSHKSRLGEKHVFNLNTSPGNNCNFQVNDDDNNNNNYSNPHAFDLTENDYHGDGSYGGYSEPVDESDDGDDLWKPLNPHEPGNLKIKPFKKVKVLERKSMSSTKRISLATQFPIARLHGTISPEFTEIWKEQILAWEKLRESQSPPLYEKLRQSLDVVENETCNSFSSNEDENDNECAKDIPDFEMPESMYMDMEVSANHEKHGNDYHHSDNNQDIGQEDPDSQASLEELCRSHLDALLANIAETEKQTDLATRVSTWKQRIEKTLEEQDSHPPFDIHEYGERVLDKLSVEADGNGGMSFVDVVKGQEKHDVARTFSALLQLVNNGNVDLDRGESGGQSVCYTPVNPFYVRLLSSGKRREEVQLRSSKKRVKSPMGKRHIQADRDSPIGKRLSTIGSSSLGFTSVKAAHPNGKHNMKLGKVSAVRCTPEGKRRRRSRFIETVDMQSAG